ncbi:hypothetical protein ACFSUI_25400 [Ralstonia solanacearum]
MDWDDCLRYEEKKGMNYQLVHNALVIAARMHAQDLPKLGQAVARLHDRMQRGEQPKDGDPLIMKSQEDCANYLAATPASTNAAWSKTLSGPCCLTSTAAWPRPSRMPRTRSACWNTTG